MRRTIVGVLVVSLALATFTVAEAGKKKQKPRKFKSAYTCPCGVQVLGIGPGFASGNQGGVTIPTLPSEKFISIKMTDDSGLPVYFSAAQNLEGDDNIYETDLGDGCGKTEEPLSIVEPGADIIAFIYSGTCDGGVAVATGGNAVAVLSATS